MPMTWTADEILIELRQNYGADLSFGDLWARWKADNPDYVETTALEWYVTNGAIGDTYADAAFDYWHGLATADQLIAENGSHIKTEANKFLVIES